MEFVIEDQQTGLAVETVRAVASDAVERITIAPVDGTSRSRVIVRVRAELTGTVMKAVMNALDKTG